MCALWAVVPLTLCWVRARVGVRVGGLVRVVVVVRVGVMAMVRVRVRIRVTIRVRVGGGVLLPTTFALQFL